MILILPSRVFRAPKIGSFSIIGPGMHELLPLLMQAGYFGIAYGPEPRREPEPKLVLPL